MLEKIKSKKEYLIIFAVVILIMIPVLSDKYISGDDSVFHVSNVFARYSEMLQGDFSELKVLPLIAKDFGYGTGIFYPALAHTVTSIIAYIFSGNITLSLKIVHFVVYFISAVMMYKLVNTVFKNKYVALIASIFYITFPYSITEVFTRNALAESFVYMFMPTIILGLYHLFYGEKKCFYLFFIIGYVGLMNSHLVLAVYFTVLIMVYLILNIKKVLTKENLIHLIISSVLILLIVSPFIVPMLEHKMLKVYAVFEGENMANYDTIINSALEPKEFIFQKTSEKFSTVNYYLNILALIMAIMSIISYKKILKNKTEQNFFKFLVCLAIITTFLISNLFPWKYVPKIMRMIQFAWRLETILIIALSIMAALYLRDIKNKKAKILILIFIIAFNGYTVYNTYNFDTIKSYSIEEVDISEYGMGWEKEYLPMNTINDLSYFYNRNNEIIVKKGKAEITIEENNTPDLKAKITNCDEETTIELPRIYYLGYDLKIIDENGKKEKLEIYMNEKGFMETKINSNGVLELDYTGTVANKVANIISIITIIGCVCTYIYFFKININYEDK